MQYPARRQSEVVVRELQDETLVYDLRSNKAHNLNPVASFVWHHCDGKTSQSDLASMVQKEFGVDEAATVVELALEQFSSRDLLTENLPEISSEAREARRDVLKKMAAALVSLPLVSTLAAPAAMAQGSPTVMTTTAGMMTSTESG